MEEKRMPTSFALSQSTVDSLDEAKLKMRKRLRDRLDAGKVNKTAMVEVALDMALSDLEAFAERLVEFQA
jgi:hypothetical protein